MRAMAEPCPARRSMRRLSSDLPAASRPAVGSSSTSSGGGLCRLSPSPGLDAARPCDSSKGGPVAQPRKAPFREMAIDRGAVSSSRTLPVRN